MCRVSSMAEFIEMSHMHPPTTHPHNTHHNSIHPTLLLSSAFKCFIQKTNLLTKAFGVQVKGANICCEIGILSPAAKRNPFELLRQPCAGRDSQARDLASF